MVEQIVKYCTVSTTYLDNCTKFKRLAEKGPVCLPSPIFPFVLALLKFE